MKVSQMATNISQIQKNLIYKDNASDGSKISNYASLIYLETDNPVTVTYDSNMNAIKLLTDGGSNRGVKIAPVDGYNNFRITTELYIDTNQEESIAGIIIGDINNGISFGCASQRSVALFKQTYNNGSITTNQISETPIIKQNWFKITLEVINGVINVFWY